MRSQGRPEFRRSRDASGADYEQFCSQEQDAPQLTWFMCADCPVQLARHACSPHVNVEPWQVEVFAQYISHEAMSEQAIWAP
jgi:hypothetical protein